MNLSDEKKLSKIKEHVKKIEYLKYINNNILTWDRTSNMPKKAIGFRGETMSFLAGELYKLSEDREFLYLIKHFEDKDPSELDMKTNSMIRRIKRNKEYINMIPQEEYKDYIKLITHSEEVWSKSKKNNDFESIVPYLERIVNHFKNFSEYWGYEEEPYDALLSFYETGVSVEMIDPMFNELKDFTIDLLDKIKSSGVKIKKNVLKGKFKKENQSEMTRDILARIGFDFEAGRLDEGEHPTILSNCNKDVRIITSYDEDSFIPAFTTALHAGGQALYEQGISSDLYGSLLAEPSSMLILETIGKFYENILGKDKNFWDFYYPILREKFDSLKKVSKNDFYKSINKVETSFIRMDADELTYNLHIIIRYEIEKDLINNKLEVKDIPKVWNKKFKDYFGVEPPSDTLGVLQDVHWFSGYFGYFPSYILGNFHAAQIYYTLKRELPDYESIVSSGNWKEINEWFKGKIFMHGAIYEPQELMYIVTDENLKSKYFINYLREKYEMIYDI